MRFGSPLVWACAVALALAAPAAALARSIDDRQALLPNYQGANCAGDEAMSFDPNPGNVGQNVNVNVTSARPSVNVSLQGPWNPQYIAAGPGGKGTIWRYRFTPGGGGVANFNFYVGPVLCTANGVQINGGGPPPPQPGGFNLQTSASTAPGVITITSRNAAGAPGQQVRFSIIVSGPLGNGGGPAHSGTFTLNAADQLSVQYPFNFPGAAPATSGQYHIEWTDLGGNDYNSTYVRVP